METYPRMDERTNRRLDGLTDGCEEMDGGIDTELLERGGSIHHY